MNPILASFLLSFILFLPQDPGGLKTGETAPDFSGTDQNGAKFHLYETLDSKPVVLIFYRGEWCPNCNKHLSAIQDSLQFILDKGAEVIAVAPELPESIDKTIKKTGATFTLIHDENYKVMNDYKVAFTVDDETVQRYKKWNIDLTAANGDDSNTLPVTATYIIGKDKKISFVHYDTNYKYGHRASVNAILQHL